MNRIIQRLDADDWFFLAVLSVLIVVIVIGRDIVDVIFLICTLSLYLKHKLFN